jgi:hypothetical protein
MDPEVLMNTKQPGLQKGVDCSAIPPETQICLGYSCERAVETPAGFELRAIGIPDFSCVASSCSGFIGTSVKGRAVETPAGLALRAIGISDSLCLKAAGGFSFVLIRLFSLREASFSLKHFSILANGNRPHSSQFTANVAKNFFLWAFPHRTSLQSSGLNNFYLELSFAFSAFDAPNLLPSTPHD